MIMNSLKNTNGWISFVLKYILVGMESVNILLKWADNCAFADFDSFYLNGDCAPYGRLNYVF